MPKAFWKGAISFGMVVIPVKMSVATETKSISFHVLHKKCLTRPKQIWHCEKDNEYFSSAETVRGYEYAKEQYVVLEENAFNKVPVKTIHSINITGFVGMNEIDPLYYHGNHYLEPEELGIKPFALLRDALVKTKRVGVAKITLQKREHLCCLRPLDDIMILQTMYFQDEILPRTEAAPTKQQLASTELDMAVSLVNTMAMSFKPAEYKDEYVIALKKVVEAKVRGVEIKIPKPLKIEPIDLMSALKISIENAKKESQTREKVGAARGTR